MQKLNQAQKYLRHEPTTPETKLWSSLRHRRCGGYKFRRQVPIGPYIVDFFCLEHRLVIEVDGDEHADRKQYDENRTRFLNTLNYRVIRFSNNDVMRNIAGVTEKIIMVCHEK